MKVALVLIYILTGMLTWTIVDACSCFTPPFKKESLKHYDLVFTGRVMRVDQIEEDHKCIVYFLVTKVWKGDPGTVAIVSTWLNGAACGYNFQKNERYFVVAKDGHKYRYRTDSCMHNARLDDAKHHLSLLGEPINEYIDSGTIMGERQKVR